MYVCKYLYLCPSVCPICLSIHVSLKLRAQPIFVLLLYIYLYLHLSNYSSNCISISVLTHQNVLACIFFYYFAPKFSLTKFFVWIFFLYFYSIVAVVLVVFVVVVRGILWSFSAVLIQFVCALCMNSVWQHIKYCTIGIDSIAKCSMW